MRGVLWCVLAAVTGGALLANAISEDPHGPPGALAPSTGGDGSGAKQTDFTVMSFNILADSLADNLRPYFLYGASLSDKARAKAHHEFNDRKFFIESLPKQEVAKAVQYQKDYFDFEQRKGKLLAAVKRATPDLLGLVEEDRAFEFWKPGLQQAGLTEGVYKPRPHARDGCGLYFSAKFTIVADPKQGGKPVAGATDYTAGHKRSYCWALMQPTHGTQRVLFVVTHLSRNPESPVLEKRRVLELKELDAFITQTLTSNKEAEGAAVLVVGDFNAIPTGEAVKLMETNKYKEAFQTQHGGKFPPNVFTSVTTRRKDYIDYQWFKDGTVSKLTSLGCAVERDGKIGDLMVRDAQNNIVNGIPDASHPSDHVPVVSKFSLA